MGKFNESDEVTIRATVRKVLPDGRAAVDIPSHIARVMIRPARKVKEGQVLELSGHVFALLDRGRIVIVGDDFGKVTVQEEFVDLVEKAPRQPKLFDRAE